METPMQSIVKLAAFFCFVQKISEADFCLAGYHRPEMSPGKSSVKEGEISRFINLMGCEGV